MTRTELCTRILQNLHQNTPSDPTILTSYLLEMYHRYTGHPCEGEILHEIGDILHQQGTPSGLVQFCATIDEPERVVGPMIDELENILQNRDYPAAEVLFRFLLPFTEQPWPESGDYDFCAFRDLTEYLYYRMVLQPEREVKALPHLQTSILSLHGRFLAMTGDPDSALRELMTASIQNPVHAGILGDLTEVLLKNGPEGDAPEFLSRSFKCAWKPSELAHAYRNQGYLLAMHSDYEGAVCCYLMAETWEVTHEGQEELHLLAQEIGKDPDPEYYFQRGQDILFSRGIPFGPDPEIIHILTLIADDYLEDGDPVRARDYLIRVHLLMKSEEIEGRIRRIEQFLEDQMDY